MNTPTWSHCLERLQSELPAQQFNTWLRPLQAQEQVDTLILLAPNRFVVDWINDKFRERISELVYELSQGKLKSVEVEIGSTLKKVDETAQHQTTHKLEGSSNQSNQSTTRVKHANNLNPTFTFTTFVAVSYTHLRAHET